MGYCLTKAKLSQGFSVAKHHCLANNNSQINLFVWDPTEPVATRPLFTQHGTGYKFFYTFDGNKNVSEDDSGLILRVFATFEYKKCEEKCCFFYKIYYDWNVVETSRRKMIMCTLNYEAKSEEDYMLSLQKRLRRISKKV